MGSTKIQLSELAVSEQGHGRGEQHAADDRGVEEHGDGEADAELLELLQREGAEDGEHGDHDDGGADERIDPLNDS